MFADFSYSPHSHSFHFDMSTFAKVPWKKSLERHLYRNTPELRVIKLKIYFSNLHSAKLLSTEKITVIQLFFQLKIKKHWILDKRRNAGRIKTNQIFYSIQMVHLLFLNILHKIFNHKTTYKYYNLKQLFKIIKNILVAFFVDFCLCFYWWATLAAF